MQVGARAVPPAGRTNGRRCVFVVTHFPRLIQNFNLAYDFWVFEFNLAYDPWVFEFKICAQFQVFRILHCDSHPTVQKPKFGP